MKWLEEMEEKDQKEDCNCSFCRRTRKLITAVRLAEKEVATTLEEDVLIPVRMAERLCRLQVRLQSGDVEEK